LKYGTGLKYNGNEMTTAPDASLKGHNAHKSFQTTEGLSQWYPNREAA